MTTTQTVAPNVAERIRAALADLSVSSVPSLDRDAKAMRANALASLRAVANELETVAAAGEGGT